jgi:hypothetical protein
LKTCRCRAAVFEKRSYRTAMAYKKSHRAAAAMNFSETCRDRPATATAVAVAAAAAPPWTSLI